MLHAHAYLRYMQLQDVKWELHLPIPLKIL